MTESSAEVRVQPGTQSAFDAVLAAGIDIDRPHLKEGDYWELILKGSDLERLEEIESITVPAARTDSSKRFEYFLPGQWR